MTANSKTANNVKTVVTTPAAPVAPVAPAAPVAPVAPAAPITPAAPVTITMGDMKKYDLTTVHCTITGTHEGADVNVSFSIYAGGATYIHDDATLKRFVRAGQNVNFISIFDAAREKIAQAQLVNHTGKPLNKITREDVESGAKTFWSVTYPGGQSKNVKRAKSFTKQKVVKLDAAGKPVLDAAGNKVEESVDKQPDLGADYAMIIHHMASTCVPALHKNSAIGERKGKLAQAEEEKARLAERNARMAALLGIFAVGGTLNEAQQVELAQIMAAQAAEAAAA